MVSDFFNQELIDACKESVINAFAFVLSLFVPYILEAVTDIIKFGIPALVAIMLIRYFGVLIGLSKREIKRLINFVSKDRQYIFVCNLSINIRNPL